MGNPLHPLIRAKAGIQTQRAVLLFMDARFRGDER